MCSKLVIKNVTTPCICCHTSVWNTNLRKQAINDKLQGSVATYLKYGGVVNNQIKKGLLLSLPVNFLIGEYLAKLQAKVWLLCTFFVLAVCWPGTQRLGWVHYVFV